MADDCCSVVEELYKQLDDELKGWIKYRNIAKGLNRAGQPMMANIVEHISETEFKHYLEINGMINAISPECGCKVEKVREIIHLEER